MPQLAVCRLCVQECTVFKRLYSGNGRGNELHRLTVKFFHPEPVNMDESKYLTVICTKCFRCIYDFHSFYTSISVAQLNLLDDHHNVADASNVTMSTTDAETETKTLIKEEQLDSTGSGLQVPLIESVYSLVTQCSNESTSAAPKCTMVHVSADINSVPIYKRALDESSFEKSPMENVANTKDKSSSQREYKIRPKRTVTSVANASVCTDKVSDHGDEKYALKYEMSDAGQDSAGKGHTITELHRTERISDAITEEASIQTSQVSLNPTDATPNKMNNTSSLGLDIGYDEVANKFKCLICGHLASLKHYLIRHFSERHNINSRGDVSLLNDSENYFKCDQCSCSYTQKHNLRKHQKIAHHRESTVKSKPKIETKKYKCELCVTFFTDKRNLKRHMSDKHKKRNVCISTQELAFDYDKSCKRFKCKLCDSSYLFKLKMLRHLEQKHGQQVKRPEMNFPCPQCHRGYNSHKGLNQHLVAVHNASALYTCKQCNKSFSLYNRYKYHITTHKRQNQLQLSAK